MPRMEVPSEVPGLEVRRAGDRFRTQVAGRCTAHSLSFGGHYDPGNVAFGPLVAHNDELLPPGTGYAEHRHADVEIVSWVVSGALRHGDDRGHDAVVAAGAVQRLSAGDGVVHREECAADVPTRFVQSWLRPDDEGGEPTYSFRAVERAPGGWVVLAGEGGLSLRTADAALLLGTPRTGRLLVPAARRRHVFVVGGEVRIGGTVDDLVLGDGDALRSTDGAPLTVTTVRGAPDVLVWLLP